ncbi:MAG: type II toxin-antitoxin system prevent-host-death family antitoxin [Alphaproteobacteria bacterium]|nr:type II toxin-antitoxin system prevent-host-death family antitoxin [Alphaproteobacteria bacterium]
MKDYTATELANNTGDVLMAAASETVEITRHGKPRFVILSHEKYERLMSRGDTRRAVRIEDMSDEEAAELITALEDSIKND